MMLFQIKTMLFQVFGQVRCRRNLDGGCGVSQTIVMTVSKDLTVPENSQFARHGRTLRQNRVPDDVRYLDLAMRV